VAFPHFRELREFVNEARFFPLISSNVFKILRVAFPLLYRRVLHTHMPTDCSRTKEICMTTDASIAKQVIEDELEFQINSAKAELEVLANRAEGTMVKAEVEAYETLMPKLQAIQQKMQDLKKSTGAQWQQTKADLEALISDFKESVKEIVSAAQAN
jgi:hypothetical protein